MKNFDLNRIHKLAGLINEQKNVVLEDRYQTYIESDRYWKEIEKKCQSDYKKYTKISDASQPVKTTIEDVFEWLRTHYLSPNIKK
jgi:hypothetical protein